MFFIFLFSSFDFSTFLVFFLFLVSSNFCFPIFFFSFVFPIFLFLPTSSKQKKNRPEVPIVDFWALVDKG